MNINIVKAIAWKEIRLISGFIAAFTMIFIIAIYYDFFVEHAKTVKPGTFQPQNTYFFLMLFSFIITFLSAAGFKIMERMNQSDSFLLTKPIERKWIFWSYYFSGIICWLIWMTIGFSILYPAAFMREILNEIKNEDFLMIIVFYFFFYNTMFSLAINVPNLPLNILFICILISFEIMYTKNRFIENSFPVIILISIVALFLSNILYIKNPKT